MPATIILLLQLQVLSLWRVSLLLCRGVDLESLLMGQRDALLVFRTLCKMAMKEGKEELIVRTKVLSLELLQGLLESVSREFTVNFAFIDSIKMYLCYALVRAYVSPVEKVFQLACNIFATLVTRFRESLKVCGR